MKSSRSSDNLLFKPPLPCAVPRKSKATSTADGIKKPTVKNDDFKTPFPIRTRSRSQSKFDKENFGLDMASIIISSGTREVFAVFEYLLVFHLGFGLESQS